MSDSSSSSDDETKQRLRLAVWDVKQHDRYYSNGSKSAAKNASQSQANKLSQPSLRPSKSDPQFSEDYGAIQASPELKSFVAKKLTSFLDGVIKEYHTDDSKPPEAEIADEFRLFSTSKPGNVVSSADVKQQTRKKVESSSESDSDEERQRLASVAVSFGDVIHSQAILSAVEEPKPSQVITNNSSPWDVTSKTLTACKGSNKEDTQSQLEGVTKKKKKKKRKDLDQKVRSTDSPSTAGLYDLKVSDKTSHNNKRKQLSEIKRTKADNFEEAVSLYKDDLQEESNGDMSSQIDGDMGRKRKKKLKKKSVELVSSNNDLNGTDDVNDEDNELSYVKKRKKKKKSKESPL